MIENLSVDAARRSDALGGRQRTPPGAVSADVESPQLDAVESDEMLLDPTITFSPQASSGTVSSEDEFDVEHSSSSASSESPPLAEHVSRAKPARRAPPKRVDDHTLNASWQMFEQSRPEMAASRSASKQAPPKEQPTFSPAREEPAAPTQRISLFKQKMIVEREESIGLPGDDPNLPELQRRYPLLARRMEMERAMVDEFLLERLAALQLPHSANVPRGEVAPLGTIQRIEFDTLTEAEVRRIATVHVTTTEHFEKLNDGTLQPVENGLLSERMGPIERKHKCPICNGEQSTPSYLEPHGEKYMCDGHHGRIEFAGALFHPELVDTLVSALRCFCWDCGSLPGTDKQNREIICALARPDIYGKHKSRAERLALLSATFAKRVTCAQCFRDDEARANVRCRKCAIYCATLRQSEQAAGVPEEKLTPLNGQCQQCEAPTTFRAQIRKLHKQPFNSFPYLVHFELPKRQGTAFVRRTGVIGIDGVEIAEPESRAERDQARLDNYCERNGIREREMELTPERARKIILGIGNDAALLLSVGVWHDAATGTIDTARHTQRQLSAAKSAAIEWLESMAARDLLMLPNNGRGSDVSAGLAETRLNELTTAAADLMRADDRLRETQLASAYGRGAARAQGVGYGIMRFKDHEKWHSQSHSDQVYNSVAELYGRVQYYWVIMVRATHAPFWLPTGNRSIRVPDKAQKGAERTKNKGRGLATDMGGKEGLMRLALQGSRTDFSLRSVIVPDPLIDIDEVAISREFAQRLTVPIRLAAYNIERVLRAAEGFRVAASRGRKSAKPLIFDADRREAISYTEQPYSVYESSLARIGSFVELPLATAQAALAHPVTGELGTMGSVIVMNRQPSLHKPSITAHRLRILPDDDDDLTTNHDTRRENDAAYAHRTTADPPFRRSTRTSSAIRINTNVVKIYNADFDGDEVGYFIRSSSYPCSSTRACARCVVVHVRAAASACFGSLLCALSRKLVVSLVAGSASKRSQIRPCLREKCTAVMVSRSARIFSCCAAERLLPSPSATKSMFSV